jgi:putative NIF3 family GTP cyclohydrolase 1 type 2
MFATIGVIQKAIGAGANFIIAHEPAFYNHLDETEWLENDEVYRYKTALLQKHGIAVWRNHDYIHRHLPDGVMQGVIHQLNWEKYKDQDSSRILIPSMSLKALVTYVKERLGIATLRYIGDLKQSCKKILLMPGAAGGRRQIEMIMANKPDVLLCGEIQEWETAEYVRDARSKGQELSLIVMGHIASEEAGSAYMANWLNQKLPGTRSTHTPCGNSLSFL